MNKTFASLTAAAVVALATSMTPAQAEFTLERGAQASFHDHVATASIAPVRVDAHLVAGGVIPRGVTLHAVPLSPWPRRS